MPGLPRGVGKAVTRTIPPTARGWKCTNDGDPLRAADGDFRASNVILPSWGHQLVVFGTRHIGRQLVVLYNIGFGVCAAPATDWERHMKDRERVEPPDGQPYAPNPNHPLVQPTTPKPLVFEGELRLQALSGGAILQSDSLDIELGAETGQKSLSVRLDSYNGDPDDPIPQRHPELLAFANKLVRVTVEVIG